MRNKEDEKQGSHEVEVTLCLVALIETTNKRPAFFGQSIRHSDKKLVCAQYHVDVLFSQGGGAMAWLGCKIRMSLEQISLIIVLAVHD